MKKGEGSIKTVALDWGDEGCNVEVVVIFASCYCEEVEFGYLQVAFDGEAEGTIFTCFVYVGQLEEYFLHFIDWEVSLVFFKFLGERSSQYPADPFFGSEVLIDNEWKNKVKVTVLFLIENPEIFVGFGNHAGAIDLIGEIEWNSDDLFGLFDRNIGGSLIL